MNIKFLLAKTYRIMIIGISLLVMIISYLLESSIWLFYSAMLIWLHNLVFSIEKINYRTGFFIFQLALFNFLLGGTFINYIETGNSLYDFNNNVLIHSYFTIYISQFFLFLSYSFIEKRKFIKDIEKKPNENKGTFIKIIRFTSLLVVLITFLPYIWEVYDRINYVSNNSYADIYLRESSNLPFIIQKLAQIFEPSFFVYLGTMPIKKKAMLPMLLYLFASGMSIFVGARADFARSIMVIFFYFLARDRWEKLGEEKTRWIGKKEIIASIMIVPILMLFLYNVGNSRWDETGTTDTALEGIKNFAVEQGVSISVIHYAKLHEEEIPNNNYLSGPLLKLFVENPISRELFGFETYGNQTVESALYGNRFGDTISYLVMPERYVLGYGMGSSYIAEVYHSLGYLGLILINAFFGLAIVIIDRAFGKNVWITAISLLMLYRLIYSPRATTFDFISNTFNITYVLLFIVILLLSKILYETTLRRNNKLK
ncbi:O-antigen polysaccharide polymerase Wzy family protein [Oceanobacillus oncorhynchi]|uniref:O-antigen polysaccharide polymerase Wzy family protein n=1 Tax=Oceanobacillus oncorhynchi TaxID=545501 RepID=UPI0034D62F53